MRTAQRILALAAMAALLVPATAVAGKPDNPGSKGKGKAKNPVVTYVFKGTYNADGSVQVMKGNGFVRKGGFVGQSAAFDYSAAKVSVADTNVDGVADLADVLAGDRVLVQARLPRANPGGGPFPARMLVDQTNPAEDEVVAP